MREKHTTATKVARELGISGGTLSQVINGNPTIESLANIAVALGVELKEIIKEDV